MSFTNVKDWLNQQKTSVQESVTRFKNKDFLEAVVAGCALVAAADGQIDAKEKETMAGFIQRNDALKVFDMTTVIETFNKFISSFEFNAMIGKAETLKAVHKIKHNAEASRLLIRVCCAIGMADGDFDQSEKAVIREMCLELGLAPAEFGLEGTTSNQTEISSKQSNDITPKKTFSKQDLMPFQSKEFLDAVLASCALVATADNNIDAQEKATLTRLVQDNVALKAFDTAQVMNAFNKMITNFEFSPNIGKTEAFKAVEKFKDHREAAHTLIGLCCEIGRADGELNTDEKAMVQQLCKNLGLNPSEFGV